MAIATLTLRWVVCLSARWMSGKLILIEFDWPRHLLPWPSLHHCMFHIVQNNPMNYKKCATITYTDCRFTVRQLQRLFTQWDTSMQRENTEKIEMMRSNLIESLKVRCSCIKINNKYNCEQNTSIIYWILISLCGWCVFCLPGKYRIANESN